MRFVMFEDRYGNPVAVNPALVMKVELATGGPDAKTNKPIVTPGLISIMFGYANFEYVKAASVEEVVAKLAPPPRAVPVGGDNGPDAFYQPVLKPKQ